jgi:dihydrofolate reductase
MAVWINDATKLVFSKTRSDVAWKNSRLLREVDPGEIDALKKQPGKDMMIFGSGSLVTRLTEHGLIDEYQLVVSPIFLGSGRTLIDGLSKRTRLDLVEARKHAAGNVTLRYARSS